MISLSVPLKPSTTLTVTLCVAHLATIGLWWQLSISADFKLIGTLLFLVSMALYCRHHALLAAPNSIVTFELSDTMECKFETKNSKHITCEILGSTFVAPYLVVLNLKPLNNCSSRSIIILADAIDTERFRQLRILLRWKWKAAN